MTTVTIPLEGQAEQTLQEMSARQGIDPVEMASRLLKRAIRAARPRPVFDLEVLKAYSEENSAEELALADSDLEHRAELLAHEDQL